MLLRFPKKRAIDEEEEEEEEEEKKKRKSKEKKRKKRREKKNNEEGQRQPGHEPPACVQTRTVAGVGVWGAGGGRAGRGKIFDCEKNWNTRQQQEQAR